MKCSVEEPWQKINDTVKNALEGISLNQMAGKNQNEGLLNLSMNYSGEIMSYGRTRFHRYAIARNMQGYKCNVQSFYKGDF